MGNKFSRCSGCHCCGCFRAVFRPNQEQDTAMTPLPKPPEASRLVAADAVDGNALPKDTNKDVLVVKSIELNIPQNGVAHHTDRFDMMKREKGPRLVVRRGQPFRLLLQTNRRYQPTQDGVSLIFTVADEDKPSHGQGTLVAIPVLAKHDFSGGWSAAVKEATDNGLTVSVCAAADCVVAEWNLDVDTKFIEDDGKALSYSCPQGIYILFNPWCERDQVYLDSSEWREEAVLSDTGLLWRGSYNRLRPSIWKYAQYERNILECSLMLLHRIGKLSGKSRADPVRAARAVSAAVNSPDDNGAVMGNWTEEFGGGTPPTKWVGSMDILQQYYKKRKPVKYGQCWVFAGVVTTICRAIGIPCRPVTNYSSAHDTQSSLTVDYFVDEKGEIMEELNSDTIWNYHLWNEVWMQRPDLGSEYSGWQAVDATPQELSDDMFRCGPASIKAVKAGEVARPHDSSFLFAEVNADKVFWRYAGPTQPLKLLRKDVNGIGRLVSTKAAGKWERLDITDSYKHKERSKEERDVMLKALKQSENVFSRYYLNEDFNDVNFNFELRDDIVIGQPFSVAVVLKNRSLDTDYKVSVVLRVDCVLYTGKQKEPVKKEVIERTVKAGTVEDIRLHVSYEEYVKRLMDQCAFNIACLATVLDTKFEYYAEDDFRVRKPDIKFNLLGTPEQNKPITAEVTLKNPLPVPLRKGEFRVEGPGLEKQLKLPVGYTVEVGAKATVGFKFTPPAGGRQTIVAKFVSKELDDVDGFINFMVDKKSDANGKENEVTN